MSKPVREVIADALDVDAPFGDDPAGDYADAILRALHTAGFVIVPKEPTEAMLDAGGAAKFESTERGNSNTASCYRAMIGAAPDAKAEPSR